MECLLTEYRHRDTPTRCEIKMVQLVAVVELVYCPCPICGEELQPTGPACGADDPEEVTR